MWDPSRNVNELVQDFVWGYYGKAGPAIAKYDALLRERAQKYDLATTIERIRYPMDSEFLLHGFVEKARAIFDRAEQLAENQQILGRVEMARLPVMYVELSQLHKQLTETDTPPDMVRFQALLDQFSALVKRHDVNVPVERINLRQWIEQLREAIAQAEG